MPPYSSKLRMHIPDILLVLVLVLVKTECAYPSTIGRLYSKFILLVLVLVKMECALECFRWMNWCHITLHSLLASTSTRALNRLVQASKTLRLRLGFADEKIVKQLVGTYTKASPW